MNHILLIAHTPLASALREAALHALPEAAPQLLAIDVLPTHSAEQVLQAVRQTLASLPVPAGLQGVHGVLVVSDVVGATPCNAAQRLSATECGGVRVKCIAGANLPMLLRAITYMAEPLEAMADKALEGATRGAVALS